MKKMWKNVLGIVLVAAISAGAAVGTSAYLINKNLNRYLALPAQQIPSISRSG